MILRGPRVPARFRAATMAAAVVALLSTTGCRFGSSPSGATRVPGLDAFAGAWTAGSTGSGQAVADACTALNYEIVPAGDGRSATVRFDGTCAGVTASGSGSGTLSGETLHWTATGTASGRGMTCPFSFANSTARREGDHLRVDYAGTVCGLPLQGSELLKRR